MNCSNAAYSDSFGKYREASVVQIKHHWIWKVLFYLLEHSLFTTSLSFLFTSKLAYVFEKLNITKTLENLYVLLLEEDHYLMPDALHVLRQLTQV
jgi:alpha-1,6-mannosyl-glycoprotein beta-1,2-N-acetylglucosaminyltransferase